MSRNGEIPGEMIAIFGPMFSGKTETMIDYLNRACRYAGLQAQVFKPDIDDRGEGLEVIRAKNGEVFPARPLPADTPEAALQMISLATQVVGFDEAQFFAPGIFEVVRQLSRRGLKVVTAGLPADFRNIPFGSMPGLIAMADNRIQCSAVCTYSDQTDRHICGDRATRTQRLLDGKPAPRNAPIVVIGGTNLYEARCPRHHQVPD